MPKTFWENWLLGPHDPKERSVLGKISWDIVHSTYWEYLFLMYILFNAAMKLTYKRILVRPSCHPCLAHRLRPVGYRPPAHIAGTVLPRFHVV